jgi:hypothetical protein
MEMDKVSVGMGGAGNRTMHMLRSENRDGQGQCWMGPGNGTTHVLRDCHGFEKPMGKCHGLGLKILNPSKTHTPSVGQGYCGWQKYTRDLEDIPRSSHSPKGEEADLQHCVIDKIQMRRCETSPITSTCHTFLLSSSPHHRQPTIPSCPTSKNWGRMLRYQTSHPTPLYAASLYILSQQARK